MCAVLVKIVLILVGALVEIVTQLVVHGVEVFRVHLGTHLDADIVLIVQVPGRGVANHFPIRRAHNHGAFPERLRQRIEAQ